MSSNIVEVVQTPAPVVEITSKGAQGSAGASAYQVAVKNGFVGTEPEWLESLKPPAYINGVINEGDTPPSPGFYLVMPV